MKKKNSMQLSLLFFFFLFQLVIPAHGSPAKHKSKTPATRLQSAPDPGYVGELVYVEGDVAVKREKAPDWLAAYHNIPDYLFDKVKTGSDSKTTIEFKDGTQVGVNKETEVLIDTQTSVKDVTQRTFLKRVILEIGTIWCKVTKQEVNESFTVETRGGVLGVRGTEFVVSTTGDNKMQVYVLEGTVMAGPSLDALTQAIPQGQEATIENGKIIQIGAFAAHELAAIYGAPYYAHFGIDVAAGLMEGQDVGDMAANLAVDYALSYVPYGGYVSGFVPRFGFFGGSPPQPTELQPVGVVNTYTPAFSWKGINHAKQYTVMVSRAPFHKNMPKEDWVWIARVDKEAVSYPDTATFLTPNTTYYWAVVGLDENGKIVGRGSNPVAFAMADENVLGKRDLYPELLHPLNENVSTLFPTFSWKSMKGGSSYRVLISSRLKDNQLDGDFAVSDFTSASNDARYSLKNTPLEPEHTYYWSVVPLDDKGKAFAHPGPPASFTEPLAKLVGPTPLYPLDEVKPAVPMHFEWRGWLSPISGYRLVVSENSDLSQPILQSETNVPWLDVPLAGEKFVSGKMYYWSVVCIGLDGKPVGAQSPTATFAIHP